MAAARAETPRCWLRHFMVFACFVLVADAEWDFLHEATKEILGGEDRYSIRCKRAAAQQAL